MATTKANIGEDALTVATRLYGHAIGVFWLLEDNPGIEIDQEFSEEIELEIRADSVRLLELGPVTFKKLKLPKYPLGNRQSFFDVVIENQGDILGVFDISETNDYDGLTEHIFEGDLIEVLETAAAPRMRASLAAYMPIATITEADKSDGIGYMRIERNFIIR